MPLRLDNARALPTCPQQEQQKNRPSSRDSRLTTRLRRCQKPKSQNASRPGRHQIGMVGEIISESWARSNRYTRARSSESAVNGPFLFQLKVTPDQYLAGIKHAIERGWIVKHESGTFIRFTQAGADLFA